MYFLAGLILVTIGWIIQFYKTVVLKDKSINPYFLVLYFIGVLFLVIGNLLAGDMVSFLLNLVSAVLPLLILSAVIRN
jgi:hypothetical protein